MVLSLSIFMMIISCGEQKELEWNGTIEEVDGVTVVKNPKEPIYGEDIFSLEEELSIGEEGGEDYMFSQIRNVAVDEDDRIYVLDSKESHIKIFDGNGNYIKTIGRKGQGPGEMGIPSNVFITTQNEVMVTDQRNRRLTFFSLKGEFIKSIATISVRLSQTKVDSKGNIIGKETVREKESQKHELRKFDSDLNFLCSFDSSPSQDIRSINPFMPSLSWDIAKNDQIVCGWPKTYEIKIFDPEGNLTRKIEKDYDPLEITEEEIERIGKVPPTMKLSIPKYHAAYWRLMVDDESRIFCMTLEKVKDGSDRYYDVFDSEGKYIAKIPLKTRLQVFKKSKLYTIEEDEEGYQIVKRYKVTWKY